MAHPRHRLLVMVAALAASTIATAAHEPGWAVDQIKREVERGRSAQVWPSCVELDRAAHPEADLWCGVAAVDVGRPGEGVLAIERYVLRNPDDVRGRLELARAYFYAGDDVSSRREFEAVRAIDPPADVRAGIDRYLEALSAREGQYRTRVFGSVELGGGYDSNVNAGVAQADIALPVLGIVSVASFGVEKSAGFGWLAGSVQVTHPVAPGVSLYGGLVANGQFNASASDFNIAQGAATLGASRQAGRHTLYGTYTYGELAVGGDRYRHSNGVSFEWRYAESEFVTVSVAPQVTWFSYNGLNDVRDSTFYSIGVSARRIWPVAWQPVLNVSALGGRENNDNDRPDLGRDLFGAAADVTVSPAPQWALNGGGSFVRSAYLGHIPLLGMARRDDNYVASIGALYFFTRQLSGRIEAQYFQNDSNVALYQYDRYVVAAKLRYDFK